MTEQTAVTLANDDVKPSPTDDIIDLDKLEETPAPKDDDDGEAAKADEAKKAEEKAAEETEAKKKLSGAQRNKIREQRLLNENAELQRRLEEATRNTPAAKTAGEDKPPREEDFNGDYFAWQRALTAHEAGIAASKAIEKQFQTKENSERESKQAEIARERAVAHAERVEDAREVIADFDKVMEGMKGVEVRNEVIDEIMSSDSSALIAYHLAQNPDKLNAMNSMSGRELAREMGRLEATVKLPEAKKATTAPAPLSALKGGASPASQEAVLAAYLKKTYG